MDCFKKGKDSSALMDGILSQEKNFYKMLSSQALKTLEGIEALREFATSPSEENAKRVKNIEQEADELRRILVEGLHQTFVAPMDREDIYALSRAIDDIVD